MSSGCRPAFVPLAALPCELLLRRRDSVCDGGLAVEFDDATLHCRGSRGRGHVRPPMRSAPAERACTHGCSACPCSACARRGTRGAGSCLRAGTNQTREGVGAGEESDAAAFATTQYTRANSQTKTMTNAVQMSATNTLFPGVDSAGYSLKRTIWRPTAVMGCEMPTKNMTFRDLAGVPERGGEERVLKRLHFWLTHQRSFPGEPYAQNHDDTV